MLLWLALFSGMVNLILSFCILHYFPSLVVSFFMLAYFFICIFWAFLFELPFPSLSHFFLFFSYLRLSYFYPPISSSPFIFLSFLPSPSPISSMRMPFLPLPSPPLHTHTSVRDMVWVHQGRIELVPSRQGTACFMCVIENANAHTLEHWLFSQLFCWRIYMKNIKRLCGLLDPDHFQQQSHESTRRSLRQIILLHPCFEHDGFQEVKV